MLSVPVVFRILSHGAGRRPGITQGDFKPGRPTAATHERRLCRGMTESDKSAFIEALHRIRRNLSEP